MSVLEKIRNVSQTMPNQDKVFSAFVQEIDKTREALDLRALGLLWIAEKFPHLSVFVYNDQEEGEKREPMHRVKFAAEVKAEDIRTMRQARRRLALIFQTAFASLSDRLRQDLDDEARVLEIVTEVSEVLFQANPLFHERRGAAFVITLTARVWTTQDCLDDHRERKA